MGKVIRFPGRAPESNESGEHSRTDGTPRISDLVKRCVQALTAEVGAAVAVSELIDPAIGLPAHDGELSVSIIERLFEAVAATLSDGDRLQIQGSAFYQPERLQKSYRDLNPGAYALILIDLVGEHSFEFDDASLESMTQEIARVGGRLDVGQARSNAVALALHLPVIDGTEEGVRVANRQVKPHVLLVDDNESVRLVVSQMLTGMGYDVTARSGALEALDEIRKQPSMFSLLLADITMPRCSGIELVARARDYTAHLPAVLMTGFSLDNVRNDTLDVAAYLQKPFTIDDLQQTVERAIGEPGGV